MTTPGDHGAVDSPLLETKQLVKRFPGVIALKGVDFSLRAGEVHSLCGENGAGKSTLIKTLSGMYPYGSYEGQILITGEEQRFAGIKDSEHAGMEVIHQELALVPEMTVAENIFLGDEPTRMGFVDKDRMFSEAAELLARFGINVPVDTELGELGVGQQQLVEIAKALRKDSRMLILDEPTAALTEQEVEVLLTIIEDLSARGVACVYISHKLDEVFRISHRITVIRDGASISTRNKQETSIPQVIAEMVGREIDDLFPRRKSEPGKLALSVKSLTVKEQGSTSSKHRLRDISLDLHEGEVVGIGGLMGAGRSELLMHIFGMWGTRLQGEIALENKPLGADPKECISQGLVLVTEDRKRYGLVLDQSVGFNLSLSSLDTVSTLGWIDADAEADVGEKYVKTLAIKVRSLETVTGTLSGGNQQKVVIGKALMTKPKVVLLDEPTRGIDVGAKLEIYELVNRLTAEGVAVLLVSSELPELIGMSDRIIMLAEGAVGGEFSGPDITQEALLAAAMKPASSPTEN